MPLENLSLQYMNNKGVDMTLYLLSMINTFVFCYLESIQVKHTTSKMSSHTSLGS